MKKSILLLVLALPLLVIAAGSGEASRPAMKVNSDTMSISPDSLLAETPLFDRLFLSAASKSAEGADSTALLLLDTCRALQPDAAEVYYLQSLGHAATGADSLAIEEMRRAATLQPSNDTYQENVAETYIQQREYDRAIAAYEQLYTHHHDRSDVLDLLVRLYGVKKDYAKMLSTIERMEQADGPSDELTLMRMNIYEQRGDSKNAYRMLKQLCDSHPHEPSYKVMLGNWLMRHERQKEAYKLFNDALADDSQNEFALNSLYDYYRNAGDSAAAIKLRDDILFSSHTDPKTKITMLQQAIRESEQENHGDSVPVLQLFDRTMAASPRNADISNLKAMYMKLKNMPSDSVVAAYGHTLSFEPDNVQARLNVLQTVWSEDKWNDMIAVATAGTQYNPEEITFYYCLGLALMQKDDNVKALDALRRGAGEVTVDSDHGLVSDLYGLMGDICYNLGLSDEAFAAFDKSLKYKPDDNGVLNNFAYYLSQQNRDLDRAAEMSLKTIKADPTNATYLDTYAWILFLQKRYDEAKAYIDLAISNETSPNGPGAVVYEHAGDIYLLSGDADGAVGMWQKAIDSGGDSKTLGRKIKTKKLK